MEKDCFKCGNVKEALLNSFDGTGFQLQKTKEEMMRINGVLSVVGICQGLCVPLFEVIEAIKESGKK
jgi:hypothetical protein